MKRSRVGRPFTKFGTTNYRRRRNEPLDNYRIDTTLATESVLRAGESSSAANTSGEVPRTSSPVTDAQDDDIRDWNASISAIDGGPDDIFSTIIDEELTIEMISSSYCGNTDDESEQENRISRNYFWSLPTVRSDLSAEEAALLIISVQRKFRISDSAMDAITKLIASCLSPCKDIAFTSYRAAKRLVSKAMADKSGQLTSPIRNLCEYCFSSATSAECQNQQCRRYNIRQTMGKYFTCNIERQVLSVVSRHQNAIISHLRNAKERSAENVTDVTDGELYRSMGDNPSGGVLTISLIMNADGARPLYASTGSLWPCDAVVAELPPKLRYSFENCIVLGMWHGNHKPKWDTMLKDPLTQLRLLAKYGVSCKIGGTVELVKVRLLATVLDLPARASIFNHMQYNGAFGCMDCQDPGKRVGNAHLWPYAMSAPEKTSEWYQDVYSYLEKGVSPHMGVKAKSVLAEFMDLAKQNPLDFMHQSYRGVVDRILMALFNPTLPRRPWTLSKTNADFAHLDSLQLQVSFPHAFGRTVQPLERWKQSKASEYKNMILYTLVPCCKRILLSRGPESANFWHWLTLYNDISRRLNQDEVSIPEELPIIEKLIDQWQLLVSDFLGERSETYNIHATRHMPKYLRLLGPVQNYSTFAFEGFNGLYIRLVTNAAGSMNQIRTRFDLQQFVSHWLSEAKSTNGAVASAISTVFKERRQFKLIQGELSVSDTVSLSVEEHLLNDMNLTAEGCKAYARARKGSVIMHSLSYTRRQKACSYIARFSINAEVMRGEIIQFVVHHNAVFAFVRLFNIDNDNITSDSEPTHPVLRELWEKRLYGSFFKTVTNSNRCVLFPLDCFECLCIRIKVDDITYLCDIAHTYEHN